MDFIQQKFLVTGGAGFIGNEVVRQLIDKGACVTVLDNFSSGKKTYLSSHRNLKIIKGDVQDEKIVTKAVKDQEVVINLAALPFIPDSYNHPLEFFKVNTMGSVNVIQKSIKSKSVQKFVQISTSEVYGTAKYIPIDEDHPTLPHSTYAVSKLAADRAAFSMYKEHELPTVIIRPFNSYGPRFTQPYIIPEIIRQISNNSNKLRLGNVKTSRDFTFVSDTAKAIIQSTIEKSTVGEVINVGSGQDIKILDLAKKIIKLSKRKIIISFDKNRERPFDVNKLVCNNKKAQKILKWKPKTSLDDGLAKTVDWSKSTKTSFNSSLKRDS